MDFGVVVGIEDYKTIQPLRGAANDARAFRRWLCHRGGGGLRSKHVWLILSDPDAGTPAQDDIDNMLLEALDAARARGGARRLYFYFSGHGAMNPDGSAYDVALLLSRWSKSLVRLALSTERYASTLCGAGLFDEVAIFVDCCRSCSVSPIGVEPLFVRPGGAMPCATRRFLAFATEAGHVAVESEESGRCHGIFTRRLLRILCGSENGIRADALKKLLERQANDADRSSVFQRAQVDNGLDEDSRFGRRGKHLFLRLRFAKRRGAVVLRDGDSRVVARFTAIARVWRMRLPFGLYLIEGGEQPAVLIDHDGREVPHVV